MNKSRLLPFLELFLIFVLPILLLLSASIPLEHRAWLFLPVLLLIALSILKEKSQWSWKKLGFRADNLKQSILPYTIGTIVGVTIVIILAKAFGRNLMDNWYLDTHFQFFFFLSSAFQEFAYRGYLVPKLESIFKSEKLQIIVNAGLFTFLHAFFPDKHFILPLMFVSGIIFTVVYKKYPNLYLITLAHAILNFTAVIFCFVSLDQTCG